MHPRRRHRGTASKPSRTSIRERILDTRGQAQDGDARNIINDRRKGDAEA
jgi:hypothetical protein